MKESSFFADRRICQGVESEMSDNAFLFYMLASLALLFVACFCLILFGTRREWTWKLSGGLAVLLFLGTHLTAMQQNEVLVRQNKLKLLKASYQLKHMDLAHFTSPKEEDMPELYGQISVVQVAEETESKEQMPTSKMLETLELYFDQPRGTKRIIYDDSKYSRYLIPVSQSRISLIQIKRVGKRTVWKKLWDMDLSSPKVSGTPELAVMYVYREVYAQELLRKIEDQAKPDHKKN